MFLDIPVVVFADRLEDITYRFSRICIEYKFLTAGNEDNGNLVFSVTETFCNVFFNSEIEVYFRISQDSPMDAKISMILRPYHWQRAKSNHMKVFSHHILTIHAKI